MKSSCCWHVPLPALAQQPVTGQGQGQRPPAAPHRDPGPPGTTLQPSRWHRQPQHEEKVQATACSEAPLIKGDKGSLRTRRMAQHINPCLVQKAEKPCKEGMSPPCPGLPPVPGSAATGRHRYLGRAPQPVPALTASSRPSRWSETPFSSGNSAGRREGCYPRMQHGTPVRTQRAARPPPRAGDTAGRAVLTAPRLVAARKMPGPHGMSPSPRGSQPARRRVMGLGQKYPCGHESREGAGSERWRG